MLQPFRRMADVLMNAATHRRELSFREVELVQPLLDKWVSDTRVGSDELSVTVIDDRAGPSGSLGVIILSRDNEGDGSALPEGFELVAVDNEGGRYACAPADGRRSGTSKFTQIPPEATLTFRIVTTDDPRLRAQETEE